MSGQKTIDWDNVIGSVQPYAAPAQDQPRLTGQNAKIYRLLSDKPRTNKELAMHSLKYTSRISDLRRHLAKRGGSITCQRISGGLTLYTMKRPRR